jgi:hypothetical protein
MGHQIIRLLTDLMFNLRGDQSYRFGFAAGIGFAAWLCSAASCAFGAWAIPSCGLFPDSNELNFWPQS